jgi:hypothetical protein
MKKKTNLPEPPKLTAKQQARYNKHLDVFGRANLLLTHAVRLNHFVVGLKPDDDEVDLRLFGWINQDTDGSRFIAPLLLVKDNSLIWKVTGIDEAAVLADIIRKEHYRWLYKKYPDKWAEVAKDGHLYYDHRAEYNL